MSGERTLGIRCGDEEHLVVVTVETPRITVHAVGCDLGGELVLGSLGGAMSACATHAAGVRRLASSVAPADLLDWLDTGVVSPEGLLAWRACGAARPATVREWRAAHVREPAQTRVWTDAGFRSAVEVRGWVEAGFGSAAVAAAWASEGFTPGSAATWHGCLAPRDAARWRDAGFDPVAARAWTDRWTHDAAEAATWRDAGVTVDERERYPIDLGELRAWHAAGVVAIGEVLTWRAAGIRAADAAAWASVVAHPDETFEWRSRGVDAATAARWARVRGFRWVGELDVWGALGFTIDDAERLVRTPPDVTDARRRHTRPCRPLADVERTAGHGVHR